MKLQEFRAKHLISKYGLEPPRGWVAEKPEGLDALFGSKFPDTPNGKVVIKAQVLAGGRGKAGGILFASNYAEMKEMCGKLLGRRLKTYQSGAGEGELIRSVLIEPASILVKELYLGFAIDRAAGLPAMIFSECGGMDIEEVAHQHPEQVLRCAFEPSAEGYSESFFTHFFKTKTTLAAERIGELAKIASRLADLFVKEDCSLLEINPIGVLADGRLVIVDAKMVMDDNAQFRHAEDWNAWRDPDEDDPKEVRAKEFGLNYISMQGNVGCLVNGAGLAMTTMDAIKAAGGEPANFLDVGGGATKEAVQEGFSIMLEDSSVRAILVNIFGGIMKCDVIAQALVDASRSMGIRVPLVVRLEGTRVAEGRAILQESGLKLQTASSIMEAARAAVQAAVANLSR